MISHKLSTLAILHEYSFNFGVLTEQIIRFRIRHSASPAPSTLGHPRQYQISARVDVPGQTAVRYPVVWRQPHICFPASGLHRRSIGTCALVLLRQLCAPASPGFAPRAALNEADDQWYCPLTIPKMSVERLEGGYPRQQEDVIEVPVTINDVNSAS